MIKLAIIVVIVVLILVVMEDALLDYGFALTSHKSQGVLILVVMEDALLALTLTPMPLSRNRS